MAIRIVDAETGTGSAGVDVWVGLHPPEPATAPGIGRALRRPPGLELEGHLRRSGHHARSDEDGRVLVPLGDRPYAVIAMRAGLYAEGRIPDAAITDRLEFELELARDRRLLLKTVAENGAPVAGMPLALCFSSTGEANGSAVEPLPPILIPLGRTASPDGTLVVPHLQALVGELRELRVVVDLPGADALGVKIPPAAETGRELRLVVPPLAALAVRVLDRSGHARPGARVSLRAPELGPRAFTAGCSDETGWVRFPLLPAELALELVASDSGQDPLIVPVERLWPHEERVAELVLGLSAVTLEGRAIDAGGRPLADRSFLLYGCGPGAPSVVERSDALGVLRFELEPRFAGRPLAGLSIELLNERARRTNIEVELDRFVPRLGQNALGELTLDETPLILAGRILGASPCLNDVRLSVEELADGSWRGLSGVGVYPQGRQAFLLRGRLGPGTYRLAVRAPAFVPTAPVEFRVGERAFELALEPGGSLVAVVVTDGALEAELVPECLASPCELARRTSGRGRDDALHFQWSGLPAGRYTLRLFAPGEEAPLRELYGLEVESGSAATDPRLARIAVAR